MRLRPPAAILLTTALAGAGVFAVAAPAQALGWEVDSTADDGSEGTLRWALTEAEASAGPDEITFAPTLDGQTITLLSALPTITQALTIDAGETDVTLTRGPGLNADMLFVDPATSDAHFTVVGIDFLGTGTDGRAIDVDGGQPVDVTVTDSRFLDLDSTGSGGALRATGIRSLTIDRSFFNGNHSGDAGGAVAALGTATITILNSDISGNNAQNGGGAVALEAFGSGRIENTTMESNSSLGLSGGALAATNGDSLTIGAGTFFIGNNADSDGGGVHIDGVDEVSFFEVTIEGNSAVTGQGGGVFADSVATSFTVTDTIFDDNDALTGGVYGGGLYYLDSGAPLTVTGSLFQHNEASSGGGLALNEVSGAVEVANTTFYSNRAEATDGGGGGIFVTNSPGGLTITGGSFHSNEAAAGGGVHVAEVPVTIRDTEFIENDAVEESGGGVWLQQWNALSQIIGSQFRDNTAFEGGSAITFAGFEEAAPRRVVLDSTTVLADAAGSALVDFSDIGGSVEVVNSTFQADAESGAAALATGLINHNGAFTVQHSTITSEVGIRISQSLSPAVAIGNTAFEVGDSVVEFEQPAEDASYRARVGWSATTVPVDPDVVESLAGNQFDLTDLGLGELAENGGVEYLSGVAQLTRLPEAGSPVIDAGQTPAAASFPQFDERGSGFTRVSHGRVDIGAVEVQVPELAATGGTVPWWAIVAGIVVILLGAAAIVVARLRGRRS